MIKIKRLCKMIGSPVDGMKEVKDDPNIALPMIVTSLIGLVTTLASFGPMKEAMRQMLERQLEGYGVDLTPGYVDASLRWVMIITPISVALTPLIMGLILGVTLLVVGKIGKLEMTFKQCLSIAYHGMFVSSLSAIIVMVITLVTGTYMIYPPTSLASFLPLSMEGDIAFTLASLVEIFSIWSYILIGIGFFVVGQASKKKAILSAGAIYLLVVAYVGGTTFLGTMAQRLNG